MLTDDQATENMAYVCRLLRRRQPRFSAALELAAAVVKQELNSLPEVAWHAIVLPKAPHMSRRDRFLARPKAWLASHELEEFARAVARSGAWTRLLPARRVPSPAVHFEPIASGEVIIGSAAASLGGRLRNTYDDAVAVEMESAGVAQAAQLNRSLPVLSIRGISDHADAGKRLADAAGWQQLAAGHAAAFTVAMSALAMGDQPGPLPIDRIPSPRSGTLSVHPERMVDRVTRSIARSGPGVLPASWRKRTFPVVRTALSHGRPTGA